MVTETTKARRSNGVGGSKYLVHLVRTSNNARTICGRLCATVNHTYDVTPREELCRSCSDHAEKAVRQ